MRRSFGLVLASCVMAMVATSRPVSSQTTTRLFETTFNCPDWNQTLGLSDAVVCAVGDGLAGSGGWTTSSGRSDEILLAANNPAGGGGKGFRHWRGDGTNNDGGGITATLPSPASELWVRWYMRYELGFAWTGGQPQYTKELFFDAVLRAPRQAIGFKGGNTWGTTTFYPSRNIDGSPGWVSTMGGATGDGKWHIYEVHMKSDTNRSNGVFESWIDGHLTASATDVDWGGAQYHFFVIGSNQTSPANGRDMYTDYDDFAVSTTGAITGAAPAAPTSVHVVR
jgi:hypothetical protein